jgi:hypothetical protein
MNPPLVVSSTSRRSLIPPAISERSAAPMLRSLRWWR